MKTIEYTLTLTGIEPANVQAGGIQAGGVQAGGVQGDHNMTALVFYVDQELWQDISDDIPLDHNIRCHVEVADGTGGAHASDLLELAMPPSGTTVPDNTARMITYTIPKEITLAGGVAQFFLVISDVDNESLSSRTLYSFPARVRFDASVAGTTSADNYYGDVNGALDALLKAFPVGTEKIKDNAVTTDKLATGAVTADKLGTAAVTSAKIAAGAVTSDKLESGAVTTDKLGTGAVTTNKIAARAVTSSRLDEGYISTDYTGDLNALHTPGMYRIIPNDTIEQHRPDEVNAMSVLVMDTGVTAGSSIYVQLAVSTSGKDLYIRASHGGTGGTGWADWENIADIADGSITTAKIADAAVTGDKIADGTITSDKLSGYPGTYLANENIDGVTVPGLYVTPTGVLVFVYEYDDPVEGIAQIKIDTECQVYYRNKTASMTIWAPWRPYSIFDNSVTTSKLADGAVTAEKLDEDVQKSIPRFGVCNTHQSTPDKVVDLEGFTLYAGAIVAVQFVQGNYADGNLTLNINGTGAKPVYLDDNAVYSELPLNWGAVVWFCYDGGGYQVMVMPNATTDWAGKVKLNNTLTSTSDSEALTAAQGKALNDKMVKYGTCSTVAYTAAKTVTISGFSLVSGALAVVKFTSGNTASSPTLNINSTGARRIYRDGDDSDSLDLASGEVVLLAYDGTYYRVVDIPDASTTRAGKVQLNNTLTSTSTTQALTAAQGKALSDKIDAIPGGGTVGDGSITTAKLADGAVTADKLADGAVPAASTTQAGLVQLNNTLTSTSTTQALTAAQGKALSDKVVKYGTCSTTAATAAKTATISGFSLVSGALVVVKFTSGNTASSPTLNISSTGAKRIYRDGSYSDSLDLAAGEAVLLVYDGSYYRVVDIPDASTTRAGKVQLNNTLTSTSTTQALTAAQGKALNDKIPDIKVESGSCTLRTNTGSKTSSCQYYKIGKLVTVYGSLPNYTGSSTYVSGLPFTPAEEVSTITGTGTQAIEYYILYAATNGNLFLRDAAAHMYYVEDQWKGQGFTLTYITDD